MANKCVISDGTEAASFVPSVGGAYVWAVVGTAIGHFVLAANTDELSFFVVSYPEPAFWTALYGQEEIA